MVNERKTEDIVREHFKGYADDVTIEEQRSESARIQKLLAAASKQGQGQGQPDFIISVKNHPDFLIVVECKGDPQRHESPDRTRYAGFAVDGALLYASHLANGYDVLAIGVSGTRPQNLRVSHHLHLKGEFSPRAMFGGKLLPVSDYTRAWLNDPGKVQQDYDSLLTFTQELNKRLHGDKIVESDRALLISSVLIALERDSFRKAYTSETAPGNLAKMITDTVSAQLKEANIPDDRLSILDQKFGFIKAETVLTSKPGELMDIAYQKLPFSASDHVEKLTPRFSMNDYVALFLATIINMEQYRYNYGRKCSQSRLREAEIKLPATSKGDPDFAYMERYIRTLPYSSNLQP